MGKIIGGPVRPLGEASTSTTLVPHLAFNAPSTSIAPLAMPCPTSPTTILRWSTCVRLTNPNSMPSSSLDVLVSCSKFKALQEIVRHVAQMLEIEWGANKLRYFSSQVL